MVERDEKEDVIDLNKLSQRELLILIYHDVKELKKEVNGIKDREITMALKVNELETKSKLTGGIVGFFSGLISGVIAGIASRP